MRHHVPRVAMLMRNTSGYTIKTCCSFAVMCQLVGPRVGWGRLLPDSARDGREQCRVLRRWSLGQDRQPYPRPTKTSTLLLVFPLTQGSSLGILRLRRHLTLKTSRRSTTRVQKTGRGHVVYDLYRSMICVWIAAFVTWLGNYFVTWLCLCFLNAIGCNWVGVWFRYLIRSLIPRLILLAMTLRYSL